MPLNIALTSTLKSIRHISPVFYYNGIPCLRRNVYITLFRHFSAQVDNVDVIKQIAHSEVPVENIRNFCIIAHVDHGKSTLADRLLEYTGAWKPTDFMGQKGPGRTQQVLDRLQVEQERGITVKAQTASLRYNYKGNQYLLNLIDTPGHVDFSNEVARSVSVCQGVILLVDANQGVQAQTVANFYLAFTKGLTVVPVLNKCDLKNADPAWAAAQLKQLFDINEEDVLKISAKTGMGVEAVLQSIVERIPPPKVDRSAPLRALIFDAWFDRYRGAITLLSVIEGSIKKGNEIALTCEVEDEPPGKKKRKLYEVKEVGVLRPQEEPSDQLIAGQVGYLVCNMRTTAEAQLGSTVHLAKNMVRPLPGFRPSRPMVFAGVYPVDQSEYQALRVAVDKLLLNDSGVTMSVESSSALGAGFRLGFLGLLHMEVFSQRLEQEFGRETIATAPSVTYKIKIKGEKNIKMYGGDEISVSNAVKFPDPQIVVNIYEPLVVATIITPDEFIGAITELCLSRRGHEASAPVRLDKTRLMTKFILPLNEIIVDFHDSIKSVSSGFASFDYEEYGYEPSDLVKVRFLLNNEEVPELSFIVHRSKAQVQGRKIVDKLCEVIPRQNFLIVVQASCGGSVIARGDIKPYRKDVTAKLYGGDIRRRQKLLQQQKEGKKKMRSVGNIFLPRDVFIQVLKR